MPKWRKAWKLVSRNPKRYKRVWARVPKPAKKYGFNGAVGPAVRFTWSEVRDGDGNMPGADARKHVVIQAKLLNRLRKQIAKHYKTKFANVEINVNSWYRSKAYNDKIGGATFSQHIVGRATDISVVVDGRRLNPRRVADLAETIPAFRNGGIGWYDEAHGYFTHVDHRTSGRARWVNKG